MSLEPSVEQNSPAQLIPAPSAALNGMIGVRPASLRAGSARQAGLLPGPIAKIPSDVAAGLVPQGTGNHPLFPGAVSLQAHNGVIVSDVAVGYSDLYADDAPTLLPADQRVRTTPDTIYDLASLSKLFTSIVAMQLAEKGKLDLNAPVVRYLPAFAANGKSDITITNLLTHTSGFAPDPDPPLWQLPAGQRVAAILNAAPAAPPNTQYVYSDLNMMTMALVEQAITGSSSDQLVARQITGPLHLTSTMYNPPASLLPRIAAEEYQRVPDRGLVHGQVHDENAWALGGVAGHAGVFSDAHDLAVLAQTMLNGGRYGRVRILSKASVVSMLTNLNQAYPGQNHGYGFELYQSWYDGALATPYTAGHTGFTGTDIVIDPTTQSFSILLTNAVHPSRNWGSTNPVRRAVADDLARAIPVRPLGGGQAWYSGMADATTSTLTLPATTLRGSARLDFALWYDTEPNADVLTLQRSDDGGVSWYSVPFTLLDGRHRYTAPGTASGYEKHRWYLASATLLPSPARTSSFVSSSPPSSLPASPAATSSLTSSLTSASLTSSSFASSSLTSSSLTSSSFASSSLTSSLSASPSATSSLASPALKSASPVAGSSTQPGSTLIRWTYRTDNLYHGRGVYLDHIRLSDHSGLRFNDDRPTDAGRLAAVRFASSPN